MLSFFQNLFFIFSAVFFSFGGAYLYNPNFNWVEVEKTCGGKRQSPINIDTSAAVENDGKEIEFKWSRADTENEITVRNIGESILFSSRTLAANLNIDKVNYKMAYAFMHWGSDAGKGSEHTIDRKQYSGEIEFIHYRADFGSYGAAMNIPDGLVIISVLLQEDSDLEDDLKEIKDLKSVLKDLKRPGSSKSVELTENTLSMENFLPEDRSFFRYQGSISKPPCTETAQRIVFKDPIKVTPGFLEALREVQDHEGKKVQDNFRPVQDTADRKVYKS